jgi:hypothetical protein
MNRRALDRLARLEAAPLAFAEPESVTPEQAADAYRKLIEAPGTVTDFPTEPFAAMRAYARMLAKPFRRHRR